MQLILVRALLALAFASFSSLAAAQAARPPAEAFFDHPSYLQGEISPTGRHVALLVRPKGGRSQLVVMDTATQTAKVVARFPTEGTDDPSYLDRSTPYNEAIQEAERRRSQGQ